MVLALSLFLTAIQVLLALVQPVMLVNLSLLTGILPLTFGRDEMLTTAFGRMDFSALRLLGLWTAAGLVILLDLDRAWNYLNRWRWHLLFLVFCGIALSWSPSLAFGTRMLAKLSSPFLFLIFVLMAISSERQLKRMEALLVIGGVTTMAIAIAAKLGGLVEGLPGLTIPFTTPALFSAYLVSVAMLVLSRIRYDGGMMNFVLLLCLVGGILGGFTRITIAALFVASSLVLFVGGRGIARWLLPLMGLGGLPALFLLNDTFKNRMFFGAGQIDAASMLSDPDQMVGHLYGSGRFSAWSQIMTLFFDPSPLVGSGTGATQNFYYSMAKGGLGVVHSEYVRLLAEVGLFGLFLFAVAAFSYIFRLVDTCRNAPEPMARKYALAALGAFVGYLIFMATDNAFDYVNGLGIYVFGLIAMSEKARELGSVPEPVLASPAPEVPQRRRRYPIIEATKCRT